MKNLFTILICALLSVGVASAQNTKTYNGFVVDKNGNPVVGAEVMAPGGGATAITESDGSFSIEVPFMLQKLTASYTGMRDKTLKLGESSDLVFKMKSLKKMTGFISFIGNFGVSNNDYYNPNSDYGDNCYYGAFGAGIMGGQIGQLGKWGWYVKGYGGVDTDAAGYASLTVGAARKLTDKVHLYFGAGPGVIADVFGFSVDLGTIFTVSDHVNVIAGLNYMYCDGTDGSYKDRYSLINLNVGVGYTF